MARFLLAVVYDPDSAAAGGDDLAPEDASAAVAVFNRQLQDSGRFVAAAGLTPPADATTVSAQGRLGDGPVRPGGAQLGGFWLVEVGNRTEAEALAVHAASACGRDIELREVAG